MALHSRKATDQAQNRDFIDTLRAMLIIRVLIVTALLGSAVYVRIFYNVAAESFYFIIGSTFVLTLFYALLVQPLRHSRLFIFVQLLIDQFLITTLVLVTGAVESAFVILYYLPVLVAAMILGRFSSLLNAAIAAICFSLAAITANTGLVDLLFLFPFSRVPTSTLLYTLVLHSSALGIVALISGNLAQVLQRTATSLRIQTRDLMQLQLINDTIVKNIGIGIFTTDMESNIRFANPAARQILQRGEEKIVGKSIYDFLEFNPDAPEAILSEEKWTREMLALLPEGKKIDVSVSRSYLVDDRAEQDGKLYIMQDLQEIKSLRKLLIMKDRLATAGEMSAAMAHEIRNPLGAISGSAQMISKSDDLTDDQRNLMEIIIRESQRLNKTLNEYLTFARDPNFSPNQVDLVVPVKETLALIRNSPQITRAHQITLEVEADGGLSVHADPAMVKQLVYNVVLNGIRAMPEGGHLKVRLSRAKETVEISIRDEGVGVPADQLETMFQPFASRAEGGVGLGLAIVFRIVREHGGRIAVRSEPGKGTIFKVLLPAGAHDKIAFGVEVQAGDPADWEKHGSDTDS